MNISYRWLCALLPGLDRTPEEVAEKLALRGAPVEEILPLAAGVEGLLVGAVEALTPHPRAPHLQVCRVRTGLGVVQVVCGAPNVRVGGNYPYAPPGVSLAKGFRIEVADIGGVKSEGMLCSEAELGLGPDRSGLLELEEGVEPGLSLAEALGLDDWRLDVEVTANRGDLLSHLGMARELASEWGGKVTLPEVPGVRPVTVRKVEGEDRVEADGIGVVIEDPALCHRYLGAVIRGIRVGPSPGWLQRRLRAAGARPINNVVDATNYVLLELGQPLHAFDLSRLDGGVVVRQSREGELIRTLDGVDRRLSRGMLAICDHEGPVAVAGLMGGVDSEVTTATAEVLLECAWFEPGSIRRTRRSLGLSTEASYRFERGVDPEGLELALLRAVDIVTTVAGGTGKVLVLDARPRSWKAPVLPLRPHRVRSFLGVSLSAPDIRGLLEPLGFQVDGAEGEALWVRVPGFRAYDVRREADLLEEVARAYGYDRFAAELRPFRPGTVPDHPLFVLEDGVRNLLAGLGLLEAQTMPFVSQEEGEVQLTNPVWSPEPALRRFLLPGVLRKVELNLARGQGDVRLFEVGTVFRAPEREGEPPREESHVAVAFTGRSAPLHWSGGERDLDLWDLKGLLQRLVRFLWGEGAELREGAPVGRGIAEGEGFAVVGKGGAVVGWGGRVERGVLEAPTWVGAVWGAELVLSAEAGGPSQRLLDPIPMFPGVDRDLALLLPKGLPAAQVEACIRKSGGGLLRSLFPFDVYEGERIPVGHRSIAFRLRFQAADRTLTDEEVDGAVQSVLAALREELGVHLRS